MKQEGNREKIDAAFLSNLSDKVNEGIAHTKADEIFEKALKSAKQQASQGKYHCYLLGEGYEPLYGMSFDNVTRSMLLKFLKEKLKGVNLELKQDTAAYDQERFYIEWNSNWKSSD